MVNPDEQKLQAKLAALGLDDNLEEFLEGLPAPVKERVEALKNLQAEKDKLEEEYLKEKAELEAKYEKLYAPLYSQRNSIVTGSELVKEGDPKGIPDFWLTVLMRNDVVRETISDKDIDVLKYLRDITCEHVDSDRSKGFKLKFFFNENPYFTNEVLEKTYHMLEEDFEPILEKSEGTTINWNPGKNITVKVMKKKTKKPTDKPQFKTEPVDSFFNFFTPPEIPEDADGHDDDEMEELQAQMEQDYECGAIIKDKLIPNAIKWFLGEVTEDEYAFFGPGDDDDDDEDEEDDDDEGDDDNNDEDAPAAKDKKGGKAEQPECKQQ